MQHSHCQPHDCKLYVTNPVVNPVSQYVLREDHIIMIYMLQGVIVIYVGAVCLDVCNSSNVLKHVILGQCFNHANPRVDQDIQDNLINITF